jgi:hypothetical protein
MQQAPHRPASRVRAGAQQQSSVVPLSGGRLRRAIASLSGVAGLRCRENPRRAQARRKDGLGIGGLASRPTSLLERWLAFPLSQKLSRLADAATFSSTRRKTSQVPDWESNRGRPYARRIGITTAAWTGALLHQAFVPDGSIRFLRQPESIECIRQLIRSDVAKVILIPGSREGRRLGRRWTIW